MRARKREPLFELGRYWIDRVAGSANLYYFWYEPGTGEVRRRSLKTADTETAKIILASIVLKEGDGRAREPKDVTMIAVLTSYWENHSDLRSNPSAARRSGNLLLDFMGSAARVAALTKPKQIEFMKWLHDRKLSVAYISRIMSVIAAAINRVTAADAEEDETALLVRAPKIIVQPPKVAEILNAAEPTPRNWHPDVRQIAQLLDAIPPEEESRLMRFVILMLAFTGRNEAIQEIQPFQIDTRYRLVALNPPGRRQTKKRRPTLPVPPAIWPLIQTWCDTETLIHKDKHRVIVLRKPWRAAIKAAGLPKQFTPYALRHFMATEFRRRGVSQEQRERWMGHQPASQNDDYGQFEPSYLEEAKDAVNAFLLDLARICKKSPFRQITAKSRRYAPKLKVVTA